MNKKLINVLSTSFLVMGLATGCGIANDEAGTDRNRNTLTPVGYDNNTNFRPLNVADDTGLDQDPALNPNEGTDGDGTNVDTTPEDDNTTTGANDTGTNETTPGTDETTPGTDDTTTNPGDTTGTDNNTTTDENATTPGEDDNTPGTDDATPDATPEADDEEADEQNNTQTPPLAGNQTNFTDIPQNSIFINDINAVRDLGIMNGVGGNKFEPQRNITRAEVAAMIMKAVRKGYFTGTGTTNNTNNTTGTGTDTTGTNNTGNAGAGE